MIKVGFISYELPFPKPHGTIMEILSHLLDEHQHMLCYTSGYSTFQDYGIYAAHLLQEQHPDKKIRVVDVNSTGESESIQKRFPMSKQMEESCKKYLDLPVVPLPDSCIAPEELQNMTRQEGFDHINKWIIQHSDYIIAGICNPNDKVKADLEYAKQLGKTIYLIERIN